MQAKLIQIIYKEEQRSECYPFARVHFNEKLTIFFENEVICGAVQSSTRDKIGVCSWKLKQKQRWNLGRPREITQEVLESDYEVLSFTKNSSHHQMLFAANRWHPGFKKTLAVISEKARIPIPSEVMQPIYQNAFMATRQIYQAYVREYLIPMMWVIVNDPEAHMLATVDSNYHELAKSDAAPRELLNEKLGMNYYPLAPFLLERLFSIFCHNNKINVSYI